MLRALTTIVVAAFMGGEALAEAVAAPGDAENAPTIYRGADLEPHLPPWTPQRGAGDPAIPVLRLGGDAGAVSRAFGAHVGFPFIEVDLCLAVSSSADLRAAFRTAYGGMTQFEAGGRLRLLRVSRFSAAARASIAYSVFRPDHQAMWMTGARGLATHPGIVLSVLLRQISLFLDLGPQIILDTDPASPPLGGAAPLFDILFTINLHLGVELPLTSSVSFIGKAGLDLFPGSRPMGELPVLPRLSIGLTFAP